MTASGRAAESLRDECRDEIETYDCRPKLVVDYDQNVLWSCDGARRILAGPMPLCIRKDKLVVAEDELRNEFVEFLHNAGPRPQRKLIRGKTTRQWAVV